NGKPRARVRKKPVVPNASDLHHTDLGNARRLVQRYGQDLRFCHPWSKWLVWDGKRWKEDGTAEVERRAKETVLAMYDDAGNIRTEAERMALATWAVKSEDAKRIKAMLSLARSEPSIPILPHEMDSDPYVLNVLNGTLDLRTGKLREHRRED